MNIYFEWLKLHFERRNNIPAQILIEIMESPSQTVCELIERNNGLYVKYKRVDMVMWLAQSRQRDLSTIERGFKHMGMYCPEHKTVNEWKTWTWYDEYRVPKPKLAPPTPPTMVVHGVKRSRVDSQSDDDLTQDENTKIPKIAHAQALLNYMPLPAPTFPDELNTRDWLNLFLRKDPQPVDIPGDWICEM